MCRGGSPEKLWIASLRRNDDSKQPRRTPLKTAAQYQPPPAATPAQQQPPRMKLTGFEMHLGDVGKGNSKLKGIFGPPPGQKTLLGSPRLHRAIFRDKKPQPPSELPTTDSPSFGEQGKVSRLLLALYCGLAEKVKTSRIQWHDFLKAKVKAKGTGSCRKQSVMKSST